jgi:CheY-like chemotaxis protein
MRPRNRKRPTSPRPNSRQNIGTHCRAPHFGALLHAIDDYLIAGALIVGKQRTMLRQKPTILCIDDEWNQLIGYKELLEGTGYKVLAATNGSDGLEMLHSNSVDAVILDYRMPGMDGDQVAARMKGMKSQVPIMLLSGCQGLSKSKLRCVDASLTKGQSPAILLSTLDELLNRKSPFFHRWLDSWRSSNPD